MKDMRKNPNVFAASKILSHLNETAKDLRFVDSEIIDFDILMKELEIGMGGSRNDTIFENGSGYFWELIAEFLGNFATGPKDGVCILQGAIVDGGGRRTAKAMSENYILMLDVDTGMSLEELEPKLREMKPLCLVWTTHSHLKRETEVSEDAFQTWARKNKLNLDHEDLIEQLKQFLLKVKAYQEDILDDAVFDGRRNTPNGMKYVVKHKPMPKLRLLFLLEKPFSFSDGVPRKQRIEDWKKLVAEVARRIGVPLDKSCVDPSRLMYTPRIPEGAEKGPGKHEIVLFGGYYLDHENLD